MRAVVVEIKNNEAAVLAEDGIFHSVPDKGYQVGQELDVTDVMLFEGERLKRTGGAPDGTARKRRAFRAAAVAALVLIAGSGSIHYASETAFAYTTVTVATEDAEVELTLNRRDEVIAAAALNEESETIVRKLQVSRTKRKKLETALSELTENEEDTGADIVVESRDAGREEELTERARTVLPARIGHPAADMAPVQGENPAPGVMPGQTEDPAAGTKPEQAENPEAGAKPGQAEPYSGDREQGHTGTPSADTKPGQAEDPAADMMPEHTERSSENAAQEQTDEHAAGTKPGQAEDPAAGTKPGQTENPAAGTEPGQEGQTSQDMVPAQAGPAAGAFDAAAPQNAGPAPAQMQAGGPPM